MFSMCFARLTNPRLTASGSGLLRSDLSMPALYLRDLTVETITHTLGRIPASRHLMSRNFSAPRSAPKPASVTVISPSFIAAFVAMMVLHPWEMFANGPPWTNAGTPSSVCTRLGLSASFRTAVMAPSAPRSPAVMFLPDLSCATTSLASLALRSLRSFAMQNVAITSEAAVIVK